MIFPDRHHAGELLAQKLSTYGDSHAIVIGLARGGMVTASSVATFLRIPLDVLVIKKIGSPHDPEFALGAVAPDGIFFVDWKLAHMVGVDEAYIRSQITKLDDQIHQKTIIYRKGKNPYFIKEKTVIIIDDGAATGATIQAAIRWCRKKHVARLVVGLPIAAPETVAQIKPEVDALVVLDSPRDFRSVGQWYEEFPQVEDTQVVELLRRQEDGKIKRQI